MEPRILGPLDGYPPPEEYRAPVRRAAASAGEWEARTYADELLERGEYPHVRVECGCGRRRPAFAMVDVTSMPERIRGDAVWACGTCIGTWRIRNPGELDDAASLAESLGAPVATVTALRSRERRR